MPAFCTLGTPPSYSASLCPYFGNIREVLKAPVAQIALPIEVPAQEANRMPLGNCTSSPSLVHSVLPGLASFPTSLQPHPAMQAG